MRASYAAFVFLIAHHAAEQGKNIVLLMWIDHIHTHDGKCQACSSYGYGHTNLHLAGATLCMQVITLAQVILRHSLACGQSESKVTPWKVPVIQKNMCLQCNRTSNNFVNFARTRKRLRK